MRWVVVRAMLWPMSPSRRDPGQQRSREMVGRVVDAAERVLQDVDYQRASTNRIAAAAGVSPGSVYQYFADKDEIFDAVLERLAGRLAGGIVPVLHRAALLEPAPRTRMIVEAVLDAFEREAGLLRALIDRTPAAEQQQAVSTIRVRAEEMVYQSLASTPDAVRDLDLDRATWMIVELGAHFPVRYVLDRPPIAREAFVEDLVDLILRVAYRS
jgi:AcrR family transcriptional regulator